MQDHGKEELLLQGPQLKGLVRKSGADFSVTKGVPDTSVLFIFLFGLEEPWGNSINAFAGGVVNDDAVPSDAAAFLYQLRPVLAMGQDAEGEDNIEGLIWKRQVNHIADYKRA